MSDPIVAAPEAAPESTPEVAPETQEVAPEAPKTEAELKTAVVEAAKAGATEKEIKNMVKEFKIKVNGKEVIEKIDLNDEAALIKHLQMSKAGQAAMQKAAELEKSLAASKKKLKENPWAALEEEGFNAEELAAKKIEEIIAQAQKSPEQLEYERQQKELEELRLRVKQQEDEKKQAEEERLEMEAAVEIETQITKALDSYKVLPKTPNIVRKIASTMAYAMDNGYPNVNAEMVLPIVEKELKTEFQEYLKSVPEDMLEEYIGNEVSERLRKARLAKAKAAPVNTKVPEVAKPVAPTPKQKMRAKDYFKNLGK